MKSVCTGTTVNLTFFIRINIPWKEGKECNAKYCFQDKFRPNWTKIRSKWAKNTALPQCLPQACLTLKLHFESEFWSKNVPILSYSKEKLPIWHFQGFCAGLKSSRSLSIYIYMYIYYTITYSKWIFVFCHFLTFFLGNMIIYFILLRLRSSIKIQMIFPKKYISNLRKYTLIHFK